MAARPLELPRQWQWHGLVPVVTGLYALTLVGGVLSGLLAGAPALLWLMTGLTMIFLPGDPRVTAYMALASAFGVIAALPMVFIAGLWPALLLLLLSCASFIVAGRSSLRVALSPGVVPEPDDDLRMQAEVGIDEGVLGYFLICARVPSGPQAKRMCDAALELGEILVQRGWQDDPGAMHLAPLAPDQVQAQSARTQGFDYERIAFDSGYVPDPALPGAAEWMNHAPNRRAVAWMLRHPGPPRPWLLCVHGYRMGVPWIDFGLFKPGLLHKRLGLNVLMPVLPLHGPRRIGRQSGDHYLDGDLLDLLFAQSQALWDLRRWIAWLRASEGAAQIGVYGISLGGYNTGLLTGYEAGLDFGVAAIPVVDFAETLWRVIPPPHRRYFEARGLDQAKYRELLRPVSPLTRPTLLPQGRRFVVAASADRIVPVAQPTQLAVHWGTDTRWYQGAHLSIGRCREPRIAIEDALHAAGWMPSGPLAP